MNESTAYRDRIPLLGKRVLDVAGASVALTVLALPLAGVAIAVRTRVGSPVFFKQTRPGRGGHLFTLVKFRTMTTERAVDGELLPDHQRLTSFGALLRTWSLDELPELWNVLKGDMSLVGPRPLLAEYLDLYDDEQMRRHAMRPGLTGLAQVNGRNDQSWEERLLLDVWYVDHWSLLLDLRILALTVVRVLSREGTSAPGHATMPRFGGTDGSSRRSGERSD